jgi:cytidylate kinase
VILARGAGRVLPEDARLHVKIVAPVDQRVAFIAEVNRMSTSDARQFVMEKDAARDAFLSAKLGADTTDLTQYDLIVNTSHLGVEAAAQIISAAAREKESFLERRVDERPWRVGMP